jgi:hypothetical protein
MITSRIGLVALFSAVSAGAPTQVASSPAGRKPAGLIGQ